VRPEREAQKPVLLGLEILLESYNLPPAPRPREPIAHDHRSGFIGGKEGDYRYGKVGV